MNEKLDLVQILKDCPIGTKFYSSYLGKNVIFIEIYDNHIKCEYSSQIDSLNCSIQFRKDGSLYPGGDCMLFPSKDQRDWSKWHRPFVDGDIVYYDKFVSIFKKWGDETLFYSHISIEVNSGEIKDRCFGKFIRKESRFATEKEKQKLFKAIQENGYQWSAKTKTLEKLTESKFKVGTKIIHKSTGLYCTLGEYAEDISAYRTDIGLSITPKDLEQWELFPNKFDPKTLKSFDKVLMTDSF